MTSPTRITHGALRHPGSRDHLGRADHLRKDPAVHLSDRLALALAHERHARERELAALERRHHPRVHRSLRRRLGASLVRFGEWVAAEPSAPAWTG